MANEKFNISNQIFIDVFTEIPLGKRKECLVQVKAICDAYIAEIESNETDDLISDWTEGIEWIDDGVTKVNFSDGDE